MGSDEYVCAMCHETYTKGRDDSEAIAECVENFGEFANEGLVLVCRDCYASMIKADPPSYFVEREAKKRRPS